MTTLAQLHTDQLRRFYKNAWLYRKRLREHRVDAALSHLIRAERNQEAAEDALAMNTGEQR